MLQSYFFFSLGRNKESFPGEFRIGFDFQKFDLHTTVQPFAALTTGLGEDITLPI